MVTTLKPPPDGEHPIVAALGILAIGLTVALILWARVSVHGTRDLEVALSEPGPKAFLACDKPARERKLDDAVATGRWAAGFTP